MKRKSSPDSLGPKAIAASTQLVAKAAAAFANVPRMTVNTRKRTVKLKRGAHQIIPTIAYVAKKFAVEVPGVSVDEMLSSVETAQSLESLLATVNTFYQTLKTEHLRLQASAWKTAIVTYGMLRMASEVRVDIRDELLPVVKWFRYAGAPKGTPANGAANAPAKPAVQPSVIVDAPKDAPAPVTANGTSNGIASNHAMA